MIPTLFLALVVSAAPPVESKPFNFTIKAPIADDAKIYIEVLFPTDKKWKVLTKEQLRKAIPTLMYHEYKMSKVVMNGLEIQELHFRLPRAHEYKYENEKPPERNDASQS